MLVNRPVDSGTVCNKRRSRSIDNAFLPGNLFEEMAEVRRAFVAGDDFFREQLRCAVVEQTRRLMRKEEVAARGNWSRSGKKVREEGVRILRVCYKTRVKRSETVDEVIAFRLAAGDFLASDRLSCGYDNTPKLRGTKERKTCSNQLRFDSVLIGSLQIESAAESRFSRQHRAGAAAASACLSQP